MKDIIALAKEVGLNQAWSTGRGGKAFKEKLELLATLHEAEIRKEYEEKIQWLSGANKELLLSQDRLGEQVRNLAAQNAKLRQHLIDTVAAITDELNAAPTPLTDNGGKSVNQPEEKI